MAKVVLARSARDALASLHHLRTEAVLDALAVLERDPDVGYPLKGRLSGLRCYRAGVYRIIYQQRDASTVRVAAIRHRGQAYTTDPRWRSPACRSRTSDAARHRVAADLLRHGECS